MNDSRRPVHLLDRTAGAALWDENAYFVKVRYAQPDCVPLV